MSKIFLVLSQNLPLPKEKRFSPKEDFPFHSLKLMFQALEHMFQDLELIFQVLEHKILRVEKTFAWA